MSGDGVALLDVRGSDSDSRLYLQVANPLQAVANLFGGPRLVVVITLRSKLRVLLQPL